MAATKYQVMFRYINPTTGVAVTNDMSAPYEETFEIYTDRHKINNGTEQEKLEEEQKRDEMVIYGNNATNPKHNMIFAYNGTQKILHKSWIGDKWVEQTGVPKGYPYVIKDSYVRIPMSPWCLSSCYGSLEAAIEKCKILVDMLGMENVKLIKVVPFDQFIRIR